jgi:hypothetical protein
MSYVDDLFHEVTHGGIANYAASDQNAIARLCSQLMFETIEAGLGRGVDDFVRVASACHPFLQITQSFRELWALLCRDRWMIER